MSVLEYDEALGKLDMLEAKARSGGGEKKHVARKEEGRLSARERLAILLDEGTFRELNMLAEDPEMEFGMDKKKVPGDGVVTGYGEVDGRLTYAFAQDSTVMGGSLGITHIQKICYLIEKARTTGAPIVGLHESAGGRIQDATHVIGRGQVFQENVLTSGVVPQISAIMGICVGGSVYSPALTDFIFIVEGKGRMFITGPPVIKAVTGQEITQEELGGARVHAEKTGNVDIKSADEVSCIRQIRKLLGYLPSSCAEKPPVVTPADDPKRKLELGNLVPADPKKVFDMRLLIRLILDDGDFFELKPDYAKNILVGFGRLDGAPVGVVANQPKVWAGSIDVNAADKGSRFIRICDAYNIPILSLVDVPGFLPGVEQEHTGIIRHGAKMLYAYSEATVPKITVVVRKDYGGAIPAMCCQQTGADQMFAWPIAEFAVMGAEAAVSVLYKDEIKASSDPEGTRAMLLQEYRERFSGPFDAAAKKYLDAIIRPEDTRIVVIDALKMLRNKKTVRMWRKHAIMPQ
jgi:acetyl-CoA carboxylase carboxyltransferase component